MKMKMKNNKQDTKKVLSKKLKEQYRNESIKRTHFLSMFSDWAHFPNMRNHCFRGFSTKQERTFYIMHSNEYGLEYGLKLRAARSANNLPDSWDDLHAFGYERAKSWKHNSRRNKQYFDKA